MPKAALFLCLIASLCFRSLASDPAPIPVPVGTNWYGYDGNWSPVNIRVGTPPQWLSVYPNTAGQEIWVIGPDGCDGTSTCATERGGLFYRDQSSTWSTIDNGYYELGFDTNLGDTGFAFYGLENVSLSDQVSVPWQIVAILNSTEFWLGSLGLGVREIRFEGTRNHLTFLDSLVETEGFIPSHSYGYTAGAYYRLKGVPSSLTLGGVDTNRFVPNSASFTLDPNEQPVVAINSITVSSNALSGSALKLNWTTNPLILQDASQAEFHTIDSSTPFLWLPEYVCDQFAQAFNLVYDDNLQLYLYADDGTTLDNIRNQNITFTFVIADYQGSSNSVEISLPYAAFDLELSFPYPGLAANVTSGSTSYFPLRRAANYTQYTIGRSFLQEAYLTVDYERNNFSVSQATFATDSLTNINLVPITRPANSNFTGPAGFTGQATVLSTGAKAGIGVGIAALIISFIGLMVYVFLFRKRRSSKLASESDGASYTKAELLGDLQLSTRNSARPPVCEVLGDRRHPTEMVADSTNTRFEMAATHAFEMPAGDVPATYLNRTNSAGPAELENTDSDTKNAHGPPDRRSSSPPPPPPPPPPAYPHSHDHVRQGNSISPNSPNRSAGAFSTGTVSSGEQAISPVGGRVSVDTSDRVLSPVSPPHNTMEFPKTMSTSHYKLRGAGSRGENGGVLLVPQTLDGQPGRSPSRSSRFVEDLDGSPANESNPAGPEGHTRQPSDHRRFSWEE